MYRLLPVSEPYLLDFANGEYSRVGLGVWTLLLRAVTGPDGNVSLARAYRDCKKEWVCVSMQSKHFVSTLFILTTHQTTERIEAKRKARLDGKPMLS